MLFASIVYILDWVISISSCNFKGSSSIKANNLFCFRSSPDFRYSLGLSRGEKEFRKKRLPVVFKAMIDMFGEKRGPRNLKEVSTQDYRNPLAFKLRKKLPCSFFWLLKKCRKS